MGRDIFLLKNGQKIHRNKKSKNIKKSDCKRVLVVLLYWSTRVDVEDCWHADVRCHSVV